jgi:hypothetical protein
METEMLCAGPVDDIDALIAACKFSPKALFLVEMLPQHVVVKPKERQDLLRFAYFDAKIRYANYTSGRIFHQDFELRWQKNDGKTQVVYVGTKRDLLWLEVMSSPDLDRSQWKSDIDLNNYHRRHYYLFGERLRAGDLDKIGVPVEERDYAFAEVRIPRLLLYRPAPPNAQRVRLVVREYLDEGTDEVKLFRFESLEPAE